MPWKRPSSVLGFRLGAVIAFAVACAGWWFADDAAEDPSAPAAAAVLASNEQPVLIPSAASRDRHVSRESRAVAIAAQPASPARGTIPDSAVVKRSRAIEIEIPRGAPLATRPVAAAQPNLPGPSRPAATPGLAIGIASPPSTAPGLEGGFAPTSRPHASSVPLPRISPRNPQTPTVADSSTSRSRPRPVAGSAAPAVWARNSDNTQTIDVGALLGANTFYDAGYTGGNAFVANIEGGTPWRGHATLNWIPAGNIFWSGSALNESTAPISTADHATATSMNIAGKGASTLQRGIAYGIPATNFYAGNMANVINSDGTFDWATNADLRNTYYRAIVEGVGLNNTVNPANRVDVVNSSWGAGGSNNAAMSKTIDAVAFEGNLTRGSTIVFSAGNEGPGTNTVGAPATGFNTLVVGALGEFATDGPGTATYNVATAFSSRGPVAYFQPTTPNTTTGSNLGNIRARVDIAAPGFQLRLADYNGAGSSTTGYSNWSGTSFSAPTVAGGIALLADYARSPQGPADPTFATDGRLIKAVLINSADKTSGWNNGQVWNGAEWATTRALDYATGGGRMNLNQAFAQYANAAGNTVTQLINPTPGPHSVLGTGWSRAAIDRPDETNAAQDDYILTNSLTRNTELNATLSWFVNRTSTSAGAAADVSFHNLDLEVWLTNGAGVPTTRVATSTADHNNVEHLSFLVPQDGQYLIRVLRPSDASGGTYYSFAGDTSSDVYGLAWMTRTGLPVTSDATTIASGTASHANVLVAPDSGQTATLTISGTGTRINALNRVYVGGTDRGPGGIGTLNVAAGATLDVSNTLEVFGGSTLAVSSATLSGGVLSINSGANFTASGTTILAFSRIDAAAPIVVPTGAAVTVRSFRDWNNANSGRLNLASASASFDVDGQLTLQPVVTGSNGFIKNGSGILTIAPTNNGRYTYTGATIVNGGTLQFGTIGNVLPTGNNVTIAAGATMNIGGFSNTSMTAIGQMTLNGGTFRVPSGSGNYYLNRMVMTGGTVDFTGTTAFQLHFINSAAAISTNSSSSTAAWVGDATSRMMNETSTSLPITVADGPAEIDLDAGIMLGGGGVNASFTKAGDGTMRVTNVNNTANLAVAAGRLRVDNPLALGSGSLTLTGGTLAYGNATTDGTTNKTIVFSAPANAGFIEVANANRTFTLSGTINSGGRFLVKSGPGTLRITGSNTGPSTTETQITGGTLRAGSNTAIPAGSLVRIFDGGTFQVDSGVVVIANVTAHSGGTLAGTGSIATGESVTLLSGSRVAPGNNGGASIGSLSLNGTTNLSGAGGSLYVWQLNAVPASGSSGTNWDFVNANGSLLNSTVALATAANPFVIEVAANGTVTGFNNRSPYSWTVATFASGIAIPQSAFVATPTGWGDLGTGSFSVAVVGNNLNIVFSPVPEPRYVLGLVGAVLAGCGYATQHVRRKCRAAS